MSSAHYAQSIRPDVARPQAHLGAAWLAPILLLPIAIAGPNTGLAFYACCVLSLGISLLWHPGEPPILLLLFLYQWVQAAVGLFYGNLIGLRINAVAEHTGQHEMAVFLLLTGLLVMALAIRLAAGSSIRGLLPRVQTFLAVRPLRFWLWLFIAAWIFSALCQSFAGMSGGFRQLLLDLARMRWAAFILLTLATFAVPNRSKVTWLVAFGFQFALSIGGFFSSFKEVFLYALIGLVASRVRFNFMVLSSVASLVSVMLLLGLIWTAIKGEYRDFVNQGSGQQVVLVSYPQRMGEIVHLVSRLNGQDLPAAADQMVHRLMYFEFFGVVLDRVPSVLPYAKGQIWGEAVLRPFMPRLLFPNKSAINDSDLTNQYTGIGVATAAQGTSISMGYMAEAYIDFGPILMFLPIAGLGLLLGAIYRWLLMQPGARAVLGVALAPFALMPALLMETSSLKLIPSLGLSIISCWVVLKFLGPRLFAFSKKGTRRINVLLTRSPVA